MIPILPAIAHLIIDRHATRIIIIGDIHGCLSEFEAMLVKVDFDKENDILILVGDLIQKGPDSLGVIRAAIRHGAYSVRGNHESHLLESLLNPESKYYGDADFAFGKNLSEEELNWIINLPLTIEVKRNNIIVVHAGFVPGVCKELQSYKDMLWIRTLENGIGSKKQPDDQHILWCSKWTGPQFVVFGHAAKTGLQQHPHGLGIDTGCCYGRKLTAAIFLSDTHYTLHEIKSGETNRYPI